MKTKLIFILSLGMISSACSEESDHNKIEIINHDLIYSTQVCDLGSKVVFNRIKRVEKTDQSIGFDKNTSTCFTEYNSDGKPLRSQYGIGHPSIFEYSYQPDSYQMTSENSKKISYNLVKNELGQIIQKTADINGVMFKFSYIYNDNGLIIEEKITTENDVRSPMLFGFGWDNHNLASVCMQNANATSYSEYSEKQIINYTASSYFGEKILSCQDIKYNYGQEIENVHPTKKGVKNCEQFNEKNQCVHYKSYLEGQLVGESRIEYQYY